MTGIFHCSYNFYKMPTVFIKYSTRERIYSDELRGIKVISLH